MNPQPPTPKVATPTAQPAIIRLDEIRDQVGLIVLDQQDRKIRFLVKVNISTIVTEYLIVPQTGKLPVASHSTTFDDTQGPSQCDHQLPSSLPS
jgi:hypothetical protein